MVNRQANPNGLEEMQAQYLVCGHLSRACRQALFEIALDEEDDPAVRRRAVQQLKEILADWTGAQRWLRREISRRRPAPSMAGH